MMHDVIFYRVKSIYIIFWWMTFDDRWTLLLTLFFSFKNFFFRWTWRPLSLSLGLTRATSLTKTSLLGTTSRTFFKTSFNLKVIVNYQLHYHWSWRSEAVLDTRHHHRPGKGPWLITAKTRVMILIKQVKTARLPTLMVKPVSIRLYNDSRVLYHEHGCGCTMAMLKIVTTMTIMTTLSILSILTIMTTLTTPLTTLTILTTFTQT